MNIIEGAARRPSRRRRLLWLGLAIVVIAGSTALWLRHTTDSKYPHIKVDLGDGVTMESVDWLYGNHRKYVVPRQRPIKEIISTLLPAKLQMYALRKGWISTSTASAPRGPLWQLASEPGTLEVILKYKLSGAFVEAHGPEDWKLQQALDQKAANFSWVVTSPDYQYGRRQRHYARVISDNWGDTKSVFLSNPNFGHFPGKYRKLNLRF